MIDPDEVDAKGIPLTARAVFIIGLDKRLKLSILYPATTGRNFDEILRVIDSLKVSSEKKVATPVNWKLGQECMVLPSLSDEDANALFDDQIRKVDLPSKKPYMRFTDING
ncbi:peroxiredoxin-6 [Ditylenchus destructor]|uniref:Peroxiredoxin-6 n=1 Tax=Ditylenchus destructor TaxID=166010 RepID=A0AAD4MW73_9BILA|nr:peroxiredoxin-6 [Ditylenchus destructor]